MSVRFGDHVVSTTTPRCLQYYHFSIALILPLFGAEIEPIYTAYQTETEGIECYKCHLNHISEIELSIPASDFIYVLSFFNYKTHPSLIITSNLPVANKIQSSTINLDFQSPRPSIISTSDLRSRSRFPTKPISY
jgi:hypothetical protein